MAVSQASAPEAAERGRDPRAAAAADEVIDERGRRRVGPRRGLAINGRELSLGDLAGLRRGVHRRVGVIGVFDEPEHVPELMRDDVLIVVGRAGEAHEARACDLREAVPLGVDDDVGVDDLARHAVAREQREREHRAVEALRKVVLVERDPAGVVAAVGVVAGLAEASGAHFEARHVPVAPPGARGLRDDAHRIAQRSPVEHCGVDDEGDRAAMPTYGLPR